MLLHFALVLHFAAILITFCVSITFCGDYYILRRNTYTKKRKNIFLLHMHLKNYRAKAEVTFTPINLMLEMVCGQKMRSIFRIADFWCERLTALPDHLLAFANILTHTA